MFNFIKFIFQKPKYKLHNHVYHHYTGRYKWKMICDIKKSYKQSVIYYMLSDTKWYSEKIIDFYQTKAPKSHLRENYV